MKRLTLIALLVVAATGVANARTISVMGPWSRPAVGTGVVYFTLVNSSSAPDRLTRVTSPVASAVELHESTETHGTMNSMSGSMSGMAMSGVASMHRVKSIAIPAHGSTKLTPGGYHVMLIGLRHPLRAGQSFPIRLFFSHASPETATVHVISS